MKNKGIKLALLTTLISGVSVFINKFAVGAINPPLVFTGVKNSLVGIMIIGLMLMAGKLGEIKKLNKKQIGQLLAIGIIGGAIPFYLFFTGLSQIPAINGALIHKTLVLWVALLAVKFLGEKINLNQTIAILVLFASNLVVGGFKGFKMSIGELMVLGATMLWAVENVLAKKVLKTVSADLVTAARMGVGSLILIVAAAIAHPQELMSVTKLSGEQWFWMIATALSLFAYVKTWYQALKYAPATLVSSALVGATLITNLLSAIFITHTWNGQMLFQAGMIVVGIELMVVSKKKVEKVAITE